LCGTYEEELTRTKSFQSGETSVFSVRQGVPGLVGNLQSTDVCDIFVLRHVPIELCDKLRETSFKIKRNKLHLNKRVANKSSFTLETSLPVQQCRFHKIGPCARNSWRKVARRTLFWFPIVSKSPV